MHPHLAHPSSDVLAKVRALLTKAESTTFEAEAAALTAKAQELMARHRIEQAVLDASAGGSSAEPEMRRIRIDDPYADAKAVLLGAIARPNGCTVVWTSDTRCAALFGFTNDLAAVEQLFTSLLVQAATAVYRAGPQRDAAGRNRTRRFRRAFLFAFATRVGARLRAAVDLAVDDVCEVTGPALVPLLSRRAEAVEAAARTAFPLTTPMRHRWSDHEGWLAGADCGDRADLSDARPTRLGGQASAIR